MSQLRRSTSFARVRSAPTQRASTNSNTVPHSSYAALANYTIQLSIGQGQFATVWRAVHKPSGRNVAMKRVKVICT
ncbi:hypothetical protein P879_10132 [Paragonimus westermani]|uniref:Protein kinase domain-containing protein n=1 Tax=Paragonimus westermani TaxID=34504 RepID=A0A8T0DFL6_9TREM|nr:hypothetical protein P879_10132 [Paragonimus westermani]